MRVRPVSVAICRAAVAAVSLYALLLAVYIPGFSAAAGRTSAGVLCIPTDGADHRPDRPSPHDRGCCAAPCPAGLGAPAPASSAAALQPRPGWALVSWTEGRAALPRAGAPLIPRARGPPAV